MGVGAERWACVMHVSCAVSPCVDCGGCTVVQLCRLSVCCAAVGSRFSGPPPDVGQVTSHVPYCFYYTGKHVDTGLAPDTNPAVKGGRGHYGQGRYCSWRSRGWWAIRVSAARSDGSEHHEIRRPSPSSDRFPQIRRDIIEVLYQKTVSKEEENIEK